jgi:hypothetical protein
MEQRFAFVLRIWLTDSFSPSGHKIGTLRGMLQAIDSTEPLYFHSLRQLHDLLEAALQGDDASTSPPD